MERLGQEFPAASGSGVAAGSAGELRLLLKSGNVLTVRVAAGGGAVGKGKAAAKAAVAGAKKKKGKGKGGRKAEEAEAEEERGTAALEQEAAGEGVLEYDVVLP